MTKGKKQSLIAGALTSSAGIFISKALGLLYVVPFTAIAGEANMSFYSCLLYTSAAAARTAKKKPAPQPEPAAVTPAESEEPKTQSEGGTEHE